nr:hypothetical protein [Tanacetum cinerariifolium]
MVREDFRRKGVVERVGGRRWRRRERRSVAAEEVEGLGWVVEGVGGGAEVVMVVVVFRKCSTKIKWKRRMPSVADVEVHPPRSNEEDDDDDVVIVVSSDDEDADLIVISSDDEDDDVIFISSDDVEDVAMTLVKSQVPVLSRKRVYSLIDEPNSDEEYWLNAFLF